MPSEAVEPARPATLVDRLDPQRRASEGHGHRRCHEFRLVRLSFIATDQKVRRRREVGVKNTGQSVFLGVELAGNALYAIGQLGAMGVAPFAIETTDNAPLIADCYRVLDGLSSLVLDCQRQGTAICLSPRVEFDWSVAEGPVRGELAAFVFEATFERWDGDASDKTTVLPTLGAGRWEAPAGTPCGAAMIRRSSPM